MILDWQKLDKDTLGRISEELAKALFQSYGMQTYAPNIDNHGVDFIALSANAEKLLYWVQVKSLSKHNTVFIPKASPFVTNNETGEEFLDKKHLVCFIWFPPECDPDIYIIPTEAWLSPSDLLVSRDYENATSAPEYAINVSQKNMALLKEFSAERFLDQLFSKA